MDVEAVRSRNMVSAADASLAHRLYTSEIGMNLKVLASQKVVNDSQILLVVESESSTQVVGSRNNRVSGLYFTAEIGDQPGTDKIVALYRMSHDGNTLVDVPEEIKVYVDEITKQSADFDYRCSDFVGYPDTRVRPRSAGGYSQVEDA